MRNYQIVIRVNAFEKEAIAENAKAINCTVGEYIRFLATQKPLFVNNSLPVLAITQNHKKKLRRGS